MHEEPLEELQATMNLVIDLAARLGPFEKRLVLVPDGHKFIESITNNVNGSRARLDESSLINPGNILVLNESDG